MYLAMGDTCEQVNHLSSLIMFSIALFTQCREALTTRQKLIAQDYKVSYSLAKSCKSDLKKYRCNVENLPRSREARLSYLLMCLESAVHRGKSLFLFIFRIPFWIHIPELRVLYFLPVFALLSTTLPCYLLVCLCKHNARTEELVSLHFVKGPSS